jgi:hypothetical protein
MAYAAPHHKERKRPLRYHERPKIGLHVSFLPARSLGFYLGADDYRYYDGIYYRNWGTHYTVARPPLGAVVTRIPRSYRRRDIGGVIYYADNDVWYRRVPGGYKLVECPLAELADSVSAPAPEQEGVYTVNIPAGTGYKSVAIRRSGNGYVGPQGEFYYAFPSVEQLQTMYANR